MPILRIGMIIRIRDEKLIAGCCALYIVVAQEMVSPPLLPIYPTCAQARDTERKKVLGRERAKHYFEKHSNPRTTGPSSCNPP